MFSYSEFKNIINLVKVYLPIVDFSDVINYNPKIFCVVRHDIEFSIDRALKMARIETEELGITSTYTVQLRNNTYNALSQKNIEIVQEIKNLGHSIGLHQNPPKMSDEKLVEYIQKDIETLEHYYGFEVDRYAFHRCGSNPEILKRYVEIPNKINCYDKKFFHYFKGNTPKKLRVYYIADSNHKWKYGYPIELNFNKVNKIQLLTHPYSWTENGGDNYGNFLSLIRERNKELLYSMNTETNTFPKELLQ